MKQALRGLASWGLGVLDVAASLRREATPHYSVASVDASPKHADPLGAEIAVFKLSRRPPA